MNVSVIGGGAWGCTLAQALADNNHQVLIRDINPEFVDKINNLHQHPFFNETIPSSIKATLDLDLALDFSDTLILCVPTKFMRNVLTEIGSKLKTQKLFVNVSKGIEPDTSKRVSEIVLEVVPKDVLRGYVVLSGPSHAEEMIVRKITSLVAASKDDILANEVQTLFANEKYLRVYTSNDVIGVETGGAMKNAIAIVSGIGFGMGLGENARAMLITRGIKEIVSIVQALGGSMETAYGLSGIGDLIVTASSFNSRNFQCGKRIGEGLSVEEAVGASAQTVEGIRAINAGYEIGKKYNLELPIIFTAHELVEGKLTATEALEKLMRRSLKKERYW